MQSNANSFLILCNNYTVLKLLLYNTFSGVAENFVEVVILIFSNYVL